MLNSFNLFDGSLENLPSSRQLITTINAHSYNVTLKDALFYEALQNSSKLISDGISVVWAMKWLTGHKMKKIAGTDLFFYEMQRLETMHKQQAEKHENQERGKVFFLGSSEAVLEKIRAKAAVEFPNVEVYTYSPPYKNEFSEADNAQMIEAVNAIRPDVLFIGMTAPKQEKWAYRHFSQLNAGHVDCIGAVFDFYAGTVKRAPQWIINMGLEWFYRLVKEPRRMWRRYIIGNTKFVYFIILEKIYLTLVPPRTVNVFSNVSYKQSKG